MISNFKRYYLLVLLILPARIYADPNLMREYVTDGYEVLNGGDVIVCNQNGASPKVELLDLYEARTLPRDLRLELGPKEWTYEEKINYALDRLARHDPIRADNYRREVIEFASQASFLKDVELTDVSDSHHVIVPVNCSLKQIAIQISNIELPDSYKFIISDNLWQLLDNDNKAALILHEVIYKEALTYGHSTSFRTRYYNGLICSSKIGTLTLSQYQYDYLKTLGFPKL